MVAILLSLGASLCWGVGDLIAGLQSRRAPAWSVTLAAQIAGLVVAAAMVMGLARPWPGWQAATPALLAGFALAIGSVAYFKALAMGKMSVIAPIVATCVVVPVTVGLLRGERPSLVQVVGAVAAVAGVVLATRETEDTEAPVGTIEVAAVGARSGPRRPRASAGTSVLLALLAATLFGLVLVGFAATAEHDPLWTPLAARVGSVGLLAVVLGSGRRQLALPRRAALGAGIAGVLHVVAATLFSVASTRGYLSLVAVLSSLSGVITVGLAHVMLRERLARHQLIGVVAALAGVVAIAAG